MDYKKCLYRRNNFGQPCYWHIEAFNNHLLVCHGIVGKVGYTDYLRTNRDSQAEIKSRIIEKRKAGYKLLSELKDNVSLPVEKELLSYLDSYLPSHRTNADGDSIPMLAKAYDNKDNRLFKDGSSYLGQWKINGLRCFISAERSADNMFKEFHLRFRSREGTYWNNLIFLEDYLLTALPRVLLNKMVDEHYILDGELYAPGHSINEINHLVKSNCHNAKAIQFWCYDLAVEDMLQDARIDFLNRTIGKYNFYNCDDIRTHAYNTNKLVLLPTFNVTNHNQAVQLRDKFISLGFEGLILRRTDKEYQFGKRNNTMIKFKAETDGKFVILDIYPEPKRDLPIFKCKNDINNETFECSIRGSHSYQKSILDNAEKYIGRKLFITFGERSGIGEVPFHIKRVELVNE